MKILMTLLAIAIAGCDVVAQVSLKELEQLNPVCDKNGELYYAVLSGTVGGMNEFYCQDGAMFKLPSSFVEDSDLKGGVK